MLSNEELKELYAFYGLFFDADEKDMLKALMVKIKQIYEYLGSDRELRRLGI